MAFLLAPRLNWCMFDGEGRRYFLNWQDENARECFSLWRRWIGIWLRGVFAWGWVIKLAVSDAAAETSAQNTALPWGIEFRRKTHIIEIILNYLHCFWPRSAFTKISAENKNMKKELMLKKEKYISDLFFFFFGLFDIWFNLFLGIKKTLWINSLALPIWNIHADILKKKNWCKDY